MSADELFRTMLDRIEQSTEGLGSETSPNGARLFGHVPHVAAEAWLHIVFPGLDGKEVGRLGERLGLAVPDDYAGWLRCSNGLSLFSDSLFLYGDRPEVERDPSVILPFDLGLRNVDDRPEDADDAAFFIGGYRSDGSLLYLDGDGRVHRCTRESAEPLFTWDSFEAMLPSEFDRIVEHFDDQGRRVDRSRPIVPGAT